MDTVNYNDLTFQQSDTYKDFASKNSSSGKLNIRAYAANRALPVTGMRVIVSKIEATVSCNSGLIENISLPTPTISTNDLQAPPSEDYNIEAIYETQDLIFNIKMYSNIAVNQNINIVPQLRTDGNSYGY